MSLKKVTTYDRFAQAVGIEITEAAGGNARAELLIGEHHLNGLDLVHGGVIMTLGDMASRLLRTPVGSTPLLSI